MLAVAGTSLTSEGGLCAPLTATVTSSKVLDSRSHCLCYLDQADVCSLLYPSTLRFPSSIFNDVPL